MASRDSWPQADHTKSVAELKARPGKWQRVSVYRARYTAVSVADRIRMSKLPAYTPAGSFEARTVPFGMATAVVARYVGGAS